MACPRGTKRSVPGPSTAPDAVMDSHLLKVSPVDGREILGERRLVLKNIYPAPVQFNVTVVPDAYSFRPSSGILKPEGFQVLILDGKAREYPVVNLEANKVTWQRLIDFESGVKQVLCDTLSESLGDPSSGKPLASAEQVRSRLQAAIGAFEAPDATAAGKSELLASFLGADLPARLLAAIPALDFEARKDIMRLFDIILQFSTSPVVDYVRGHDRMLTLLLEGCSNAEVSLQCHMILRSCTRRVELVVCFLEAGFAAKLLKLTQHQTFDVSSDAFSSLRELLLAHKEAAAAHLEANFKEFFVPYNELLQAEGYVTKRQALRLLGEILLDRRFMRVMIAYVSDESFLQIHMNLLRDSSKAIQADAFHVFKIFAANPNKPPRVHQILLKNRERLIKLLDSMSKEGDEAFAQDRKAVVQALNALEPLPVKVPSNSALAAAGDSGAAEKESEDTVTGGYSVPPPGANSGSTE